MTGYFHGIEMREKSQESLTSSLDFFVAVLQILLRSPSLP
jgi:hypothetical protein